MDDISFCVWFLPFVISNFVLLPRVEAGAMHFRRITENITLIKQSLKHLIVHNKVVKIHKLL